MRILERAAKIVFDKNYRYFALANSGFYDRVSDEKYLKRRFEAIKGKPLNLKRPQTFNEKLQWLKLYDRKDIYTSMVDKCEAKKYVAEKIGAEHIIQTYGVWEKFDDIPFDTLPGRFVLKCTHDSGGLVIVRDKSLLDMEKIRDKIETSLNRNFYVQGREWPYKNVLPRIIAEEYMENNSGEPLRDYKFYCFNGEPKFLYLSEGLEDHSTARISFVTLDWKMAPYQRSDFAPFEVLPDKPKNFEKMQEYAKTLSDGIPFVRVDLYEINDEVYFSELTFFPCSGFMPFKEENHDYEIGRLLMLPGNS